MTRCVCAGRRPAGEAGAEIGIERVAGQECRQMVPDCDWSDAGSASAVRDAEGLVQVEVTHVGSEEARLGDTDQRIQVCAVDVDLSAVVVNDVANLADSGFKHAVRRGVRDHERGEAAACLLALREIGRAHV